MTREDFEDSVINPYAAPQNPTAAPATPTAYPRGVALWYQGVGVAGASLLAISTSVACWMIVVEGGVRPDFTSVFPLALCLAHFAFFAYCFRVGRQLTTDPARARRAARWLGFLMATLYAPLLTIPALLAVYKLDKHFGA